MPRDVTRGKDEIGGFTFPWYALYMNESLRYGAATPLERTYDSPQTILPLRIPNLKRFLQKYTEERNFQS